jgi:hypothetical protein
MKELYVRRNVKEGLCPKDDGSWNLLVKSEFSKVLIKFLLINFVNSQDSNVNKNIIFIGF